MLPFLGSLAALEQDRRCFVLVAEGRHREFGAADATVRELCEQVVCVCVCAVNFLKAIPKLIARSTPS